MKQLIVVAFFLTACGPRPPISDRASIDSNDEPAKKLETMRVKATRGDGDFLIEAYDAKDLFNLAAKKLRKGQCGEAVKLYDKLVEEFEESRYSAFALYNAGLCNEQLGRFEDAVNNFVTLTQNYKESKEVTDAMFRLAGLFEKLEKPEEAITVFDKLLYEREDTEEIERVEALTRKGSALILLERPDEAKLVLDEAVSRFRVGHGISPSDPVFYYAMAQFKRGELLKVQMREAELPADEVKIGQALEDKCQLLLSAQREYGRVIKTGNEHWASAAAYEMGHLYRGLWDDILMAPPPDNLDAKQQAIYKEVLKKNIRILLQKAVAHWESTLKMARRRNLSNQWVDQTLKDLNEIREVMAMDDFDPTEKTIK